MKKHAFLLALLSSGYCLSRLNAGCYDFECSTNTITDLETPCVSVNNKTNKITFTPCESGLGLECDYLSQYNLAEANWSDVKCYKIIQSVDNCLANYTSLTGHQCCLDVNCYSKNCINGYCYGLGSGSHCTLDTQCDSTNYCLGGKCTPVKRNGDACGTDLECPVGSGCNNGTCVQIFSLGVGMVAQDQKFCQSNFLVSNKCDILSVSIVNSTYSLYNPFLCFDGEICQFKLSNGSIYSTSNCTCAGYSNLPEGFCGKDLIYVNSIMNIVYGNLKYTTSRCSGLNAHSSNPQILLACGSITNEQYMYYINIYNQTLYWNLFITGSLDACALDLGLWDPLYVAAEYTYAALVRYSGILALLWGL